METQKCYEFKKSKLYLELKQQALRSISNNMYFEAKLILDLICNLDSCLFNNIVLLDKNLYDRFNKQYGYQFINMLNQFIVNNKIKLSK